MRLYAIWLTMIVYTRYILQTTILLMALICSACSNGTTVAEPFELFGAIRDTGYIQVCPEGGFTFVEATYTGEPVGMSAAMADDPRRPVAQSIPREEGYVFLSLDQVADCVAVYGVWADQYSEFVVTVYQE